VAVVVTGRGPHAEQAVLGVKHDLLSRRNVIRHELRHPYAQVDIGAVGNIRRDAPGDLLVLPPCDHRFGTLRTPCAISSLSAAAFGTSTTRSTNIPGVTMVSGSRLPSSAMRRTCTT